MDFTALDVAQPLDDIIPLALVFFENIDWRSVHTRDLEQTVLFSIAVNLVQCNVYDGAVDVLESTAPVALSSYWLAVTVGRDLPAGDINLLLREPNADNIITSICAELENVLPFVSIDCDATELNLVSFEELNNRRRNARATDLIEVRVSYEMYASPTCRSSDASPQCPPAPGSRRYQQLQDLINAVVTSYDLVLAQCVSLEGDVDRDCTVDAAYESLTEHLARDSEFTDEQQWRAEIEAVFTAVIGTCGLQCNVDGTFSDADYEASVLAMREQTVVDVIAMFDADIVASVSGTDSSGSLTIIAAAAGGGVVLIVIIIIVVLRRRSSNAAPKEQEHREVVAFENPMYDTPDSTAMPVYEDHGDGDDALYDEPAFAGKPTVENPLYQSTDDLVNGGDDEEEGGYLDVGPDDFADDE
jgi:hypothetical protein